jgi:hypothetical protein
MPEVALDHSAPWGGILAAHYRALVMSIELYSAQPPEQAASASSKHIRLAGGNRAGCRISGR